SAVFGTLSLLDALPILAVGVLNFATFAPMLLFSVFGGVISDRFDRRLVVVVTHVFSLVAASALAALSVLGTLEPAHVVVTAFVRSEERRVGKECGERGA